MKTKFSRTVSLEGEEAVVTVQGDDERLAKSLFTFVSDRLDDYEALAKRKVVYS